MPARLVRLPFTAAADVWSVVRTMVQPATPHCDLGANWQPIYGAETQKNLGSNLLITASSSSDIIEREEPIPNEQKFLGHRPLRCYTFIGRLPQFPGERT